MNIDSPIHSTVTSKESEKKRSVENITKNISNSNEQRIALNDTLEINNNKCKKSNRTNKTSNNKYKSNSDKMHQ